jgi:hypothetical protein
MRVRGFYILCAIVLTIALWTDLVIRTPYMTPLHSITASEFWRFTTGVDLANPQVVKPQLDIDTRLFLEQWPRLTIFERDRFVCGSQYPYYAYPDNPYLSIEEYDAEKDFPKVQDALKRRAALHDPDDYIASGYMAWQAIDPSENGGVAGLFECIDAARAIWIEEHRPPVLPFAYPDEFKRDLRHVSQAARLYWCCFVFEGVYFSGIVWFTFWPYIRGRAFGRKLITIAVLPLLLFLPLWFGYCNPAAPAFPIGGILYPYCQVSVPPGNYIWEFHALAAFPPFLTAVTQGRPVTFADYFHLRQALPRINGPIHILIYSICLTLLAIAWRASVVFIKQVKERRRNRPGFPVELSR